jgi:hypothetical protein
MKEVFSSPQCIVFDDLVPKSDFHVLWRYFQDVEFCYVQNQKWIKINRLSDGNCLFGPVHFLTGKCSKGAGSVFPEGDEIDIFWRALQKVAEQSEELLGRLGVQWIDCFARAYLYPAGSGLSWHNDGTGTTGAYVYYVHPVWNSQWGGELLVLNDAPRQTPCALRTLPSGATKRILPALDNSAESQYLMNTGWGNFFLPKPNRFVLIKGGTHHQVKKVESAAGDHARCAFAGFFLAAG